MKAKRQNTDRLAERFLAHGEVLVMRTCRADMSSPDAKALGFKWPESGPVECHDWSPEAKCGHGLHGLLWGEGDGQTLCWDTDAKWLAVAVAERSIVALGGKVKFPRGRVVLVGDGASVADLIQQHAPKGTCVVRGTATAGVGGTATAGNWGRATAGDGGTATAGDWGTATAGVSGTATAGDGGRATAGDWGTATAGYGGKATAGNWGRATAGYRGTATAGVSGTATAGNGGTATAGYGGSIAIRWWDGDSLRYRIRAFDVGENGIKAQTKYRLDDRGQVVEVPAETSVAK